MNRRGFTLIELMIVVAIIGILAAIAIPNMLAMQQRAKRAELIGNLDAMRTAEKGYHAEWDVFTSVGPNPATPSGRQPTEFGSPTDFELLGWVADGNVRGSYEISATPAATTGDEGFLGDARADIDGDSTLSHYQCNRAVKPFMVSANNVY